MKRDDAWPALLEELLHGLVHSLNNRVTSMSAFVEMSESDGDALEVGLLRDEIRRTHDVGVLIALLASRSTTRESLEVRAVLDQAISVHEHHPRLRGIACVVVQQLSVLPVRVPRWALFRAMLLAIEAGKRDVAATGKDTLVLRVWGNEEQVSVSAMSATAPSGSLLALAQLCDAVLTYDNGEVLITFPSLLAVRRSERESQQSATR